MSEKTCLGMTKDEAAKLLHDIFNMIPINRHDIENLSML